MKSFLSILFFIVITLNTFSQKYTYYNNGNVRTVENFLNNERHGEYKFYSVDGILITHGFYVKGKKEGLWKEYEKNGSIDRLDFFIETNNIVDNEYFNIPIGREIIVYE